MQHDIIVHLKIVFEIKKSRFSVILDFLNKIMDTKSNAKFSLLKKNIQKHYDSYNFFCGLKDEAAYEYPINLNACSER